MPSKLPEALPIDRPDDWPDRIDEPEQYETDKDDLDLDQSIVDDEDDSYMGHPHQRDPISRLNRGLDAAEAFVRTGSEQDLLQARRLLRGALPFD